MSGAEHIRVLIVDDEPLARDFLRRTVEEVKGMRVVGECGDGTAAVEAIGDKRPDLVLLDIRMPEVDGFGVIERVSPERMPEVVFITAHEEYTLRAFRVHALDYVVKPCDPRRVREALEHARTRLAASVAWRLQERLEALLGGMGDEGDRPVGSAPRRLAVPHGEGIRFIDVGDVDWIEADNNAVRVHAGTEAHTVRVSLSGLLDHLGERFVRIHRSAAVNVDRIEEVHPWGHGDHLAVLTTGVKLKVSRTYKDGLLKLTH